MLPLSGVKVLDFSEHGFVPGAAAILGEWGCDVIKVERPDGGDAMRHIGTTMLVADDGYDYMTQHFNRNKRGIALDVLTDAGRDVFERLVQWADVYITNQLPRVRRKLRTQPDDLFALNPALVYARGSGQGQRGAGSERGGNDGVSYWARSGVSYMLTEEGAEHLVAQRPAIGDGPAGVFLAGGVAAALYNAQRTGKGAIVDVSLLAGGVWTLAPDISYASLTGNVRPRRRPEPTSTNPLAQQYLTLDRRWLSLSMTHVERYFEKAFRALGVGDLVEKYPAERRQSGDWGEAVERIRRAVGSRTAAEVSASLAAADCVFSIVADPLDVVNDPAVIDNGYLIAHPLHPPLRLAASPVQFDNAFPEIRRHGPELGEHTREVLLELGYGESAIEALFASGTVAEPA